MDTDDRQARLAELAEQIAQVQAAPAAEPLQQERPDRSASTARGARGERRSDRGRSGRPAGSRDRRTNSSNGEDDPVEQRSPAQLEAAARGICLRLLSIAPRPRAGLAQALQRKDIPQDIATAVLDRFTEIGLIDDVAYAQSFVRVKHRDRALGRAALRTELRKLGVDEDVMTDAVRVVDTDAERTRAAELVDKRIDAAMAAGPVAARRRLLGLLDRRGYPAEVAVPAVESALQAYAVDPD